MPDVTQLREAAHCGDRQAAAELLPPVYDEVLRPTAAKVAGESPGHTLNATTLVDEAYVRTTDGRSFEAKAHFPRVAAEAMRRILIDHARARNAAKRGVGRRARL